MRYESARGWVFPVELPLEVSEASVKQLFVSLFTSQLLLPLVVLLLLVVHTFTSDKSHPDTRTGVMRRLTLSACVHYNEEIRSNFSRLPRCTLLVR